MNQMPSNRPACTPTNSSGPSQRMPELVVTPAWPLTWCTVTQPCCAFQMTMGRQQKAAVALMIQKPGRQSSCRNSRAVSSSRNSEGMKSTIVYLARMPRPTTTPSTGHSQRRLLRLRKPKPLPSPPTPLPEGEGSNSLEEGGQSPFCPAPLSTASYPSTSAQPQQQVYGASIVIRVAPTLTTGNVAARATTNRASTSCWYTCTVRM